MVGRWADLACNNEVSHRFLGCVSKADAKHGSIAVQQVFEVYGSVELMVCEHSVPVSC